MMAVMVIRQDESCELSLRLPIRSPSPFGLCQFLTDPITPIPLTLVHDSSQRNRKEVKVMRDLTFYFFHY